MLISKMKEWAKQEETCWMLKSRIKWLKEGKCNTTFFHHSTLQHRMHNMISQLKNEAGDLLETHQEMEEVLISYYDNLLSEEIMDQGEAQQQVISHIPSFVTEDQNFMLMRFITL